MKRPAWPVQWYDEIDSTNNAAKRLAANGGFNDCWLAAKSQSGGRGRMGRRWLSTSGNLFASALLDEPGGYTMALRIPFAAALAVHDAVTDFAPEAQIKLKWPNDVRVDGAKLAGILVESGESDGRLWVVVGIGMNIARAPLGLDQEVLALADLRGDRAVTADMALDSLRGHFAERLDEARRDFAETRRAWLQRAEGLGQPARVKVNGGLIEGVFEDMTEDGALILRLPDGTMRPIRAGDVELVKRAET